MATAPSLKAPNTNGITSEEWDALPVTFGSATMSRLLGTNVRYVQNHAAELGGNRIAGRWLFSKPRAAQLVGLA